MGYYTARDFLIPLKEENERCAQKNFTTIHEDGGYQKTVEANFGGFLWALDTTHGVELLPEMFPIIVEQAYSFPFTSEEVVRFLSYAKRVRNIYQKPELFAAAYQMVVRRIKEGSLIISLEEIIEKAHQDNLTGLFNNLYTFCSGGCVNGDLTLERGSYQRVKYFWGYKRQFISSEMLACEEIILRGRLEQKAVKIIMEAALANSTEEEEPLIRLLN